MTVYCNSVGVLNLMRVVGFLRLSSIYGRGKKTLKRNFSRELYLSLSVGFYEEAAVNWNSKILLVAPGHGLVIRANNCSNDSIGWQFLKQRKKYFS